MIDWDLSLSIGAGVFMGLFGMAFVMGLIILIQERKK